MLWSHQKAFREETEFELEEDMDELTSGMCTQTIIDFCVALELIYYSCCFLEIRIFS